MRPTVVKRGAHRSAAHAVHGPLPANLPGRGARGVHCRQARGAGPTNQTSSWTRSLWMGTRWVMASSDASGDVHAGRLASNPEHRVGAGSDDSIGGCMCTRRTACLRHASWTASWVRRHQPARQSSSDARHARFFSLRHVVLLAHDQTNVLRGDCAMRFPSPSARRSGDHQRRAAGHLLGDGEPGRC